MKPCSKNMVRVRVIFGSPFYFIPVQWSTDWAIKPFIYFLFYCSVLYFRGVLLGKLFHSRWLHMRWLQPTLLSTILYPELVLVVLLLVCSIKQGFLCDPEANRFEAYFARSFWLIGTKLGWTNGKEKKEMAALRNWFLSVITTCRLFDLANDWKN